MHPELRHFVLRRGGPEIVDDVVAEAFVVVWRRWDDAPADPSRRRGWVYGIVKHKLAHALRDRDRHLRVASRVVATAVIELSDPGDDLASIEEARRVLDLLPRAERDAVELAVLAGLTTLEVAEALQCSATAVTSRLTKARGRLRRLLAAEGRSDHVIG
ncbi:RNA polymerase sigma factor [Pengzhenrongella frigida]|uniref:RNA polymerase sigma factor n=2 Tax=Pengzhenrongella frigida TaxID=1259133 RepID=A0A4V1ZHR8_9MICO|nr:RNA polymerase sigma factor [Cellulomonas sp. HLT2-17]